MVLTEREEATAGVSGWAVLLIEDQVGVANARDIVSTPGAEARTDPCPPGCAKLSGADKYRLRPALPTLRA